MSGSASLVGESLTMGPSTATEQGRPARSMASCSARLMAHFASQCCDRSSKPPGACLTTTSPSHSSNLPASLGRSSAQARNSSAVILCFGKAIMTTTYHACTALCNSVRPGGSDTALRKLDELRWYGGRQPYAVLGDEEIEAGGPHAARGHPQYHRLAVAPSDRGGRGGIDRQVDVPAAARLQSLGADRGQVGFRRAVEQHLRRLARIEPQIDVDGVALVGPNAVTRGVARQAVLVG